MSQLFFVCSSLEELKLDQPISQSLEGLIELFRLNLPKSVLKNLINLRLFGDIFNIQLMFYDRMFADFGTLHRKELDDLSLVEGRLPEYVTEFLHKHTTNQERRQHFSELLTCYLKEQIATHTGFLKEVFEVFFQLRITIAFLRAKKIGYPVDKALSFADPHEPFVRFLLDQADLDSAEVDPQFMRMKGVIEQSKDPVDLRFEYTRFIVQFVEDKVADKPYSQDFIYSYFIRFAFIKQLQKDLRGNNKQFMAI